ncbi:MAG: hypothetical protein KBA53_12280 [Thermoclostridium sp.]|nr:hypothetical protein [Thermoclostridium sp.]
MNISLEILILVVGAVIGYFIDQFIPIIGKRFTRYKKKRGWKKSESIRSRVSTLQSRIVTVQTGWENGIFEDEDEILITVHGKFFLNEKIRDYIYSKRFPKWESDYLRDDPHFGVRSISPHRLHSDTSYNTPSHQLSIKGHKYSFFEFLTTNKILDNGSTQEQEFLRDFVSQPSFQYPVPAFANPLSVGLSVFCEDGDFLVITRRSILPSSGGHHEPNMYYNAVGENMTLTDTYGLTHQGHTRLSPWITAKRGLHEEMGIAFDDKSMDLILHTFTWDKHLLDYKFFGACKTSLSREQTRSSWIQASDKNENSEIFFLPCKSEYQVKEILKGMSENQAEWSDECVYRTIYSMLHLGKLSSIRRCEYFL